MLDAAIKLLRLIWPVWIALPVAPVLAQSVPQANLAVSSSQSVAVQVRERVADNWRMPKLTSDARVTVRTEVLTGGSLGKAQISVEGATGQAADDIAASVQKAIAGTTVASAPTGPVQFTLRARSSPYFKSCFPLKVYVPNRLQDSGEVLPATSVTALEQAALKWNGAVVGYAEGKVTNPFVIASDPKAADIRFVVFQDHPDYSSYRIDEQTGQVLLPVPAKQEVAALFSAGYRWWSPEVLTQEGMFQLGRLLNLSLSDQQTNVLYAGPSTSILSHKTDLGSTRDYQVYDRLSLGGGQGSLTSGGIQPESQGDRTLTNYQLIDAGDWVRNHTCAR